MESLYTHNKPTKEVEFYGGPWDGEHRDMSLDTVAYTAPWQGKQYLYQQRANWSKQYGSIPFDYVRQLGT